LENRVKELEAQIKAFKGGRVTASATVPNSSSPAKPKQLCRKHHIDGKCDRNPCPFEHGTRQPAVAQAQKEARQAATSTTGGGDGGNKKAKRGPRGEKRKRR
jgi:hypothetical protein